jgi:hypothetical protein
MKNNNDLVDKVRNGIFLAASRTYGEQYIEPFIRKKYGFDEANDDSYDAIDNKGNRYEIKACKVLQETQNSKHTKKIIDRIIYENNNIETNRFIKFTDCLTSEYLANIQNVKRDHFDYLIYVLLFSDSVKVFQLRKEDIHINKLPNWSDKHGRYDQLGKSGQFPITKKTIKWHIDNKLKSTFSYVELVDTFTVLSNEYEHNKKQDNSKQNKAR